MTAPKSTDRAAIVARRTPHLQAFPLSMRPSLTNLPKRARSAAEGSPVPAGQEPPAPEAAATPTTGDRSGMRKRMRRLRRTREVLLRELGALVVEMRRLGRENPELVERKTSELIAIDEELRGLQVALGERQTVATLVAAGVSGSCARCATLHGSDDRFCSRCGLAVDGSADAAAVAEPVTGEGGEPAAGSEADGAAASAGPPAVDGATAAPAPEAAAPPPPPPPPPPAPELTSSAPRES